MKAFIDEHREAYGGEPIGRVRPIAPSSYDAHAAQKANPKWSSDRAQRDEPLCADIRRVFAANCHV